MVRPAAVQLTPPPPPPSGAPPLPAGTRMAGVLWGGDVLGIFVHQGRGIVVRPGEIVEVRTGVRPGEYVVVSISPESMFIRPVNDPMGPLTRVPLQDSSGKRQSSETAEEESPGDNAAEENGEALPGARALL